MADFLPPPDHHHDVIDELDEHDQQDGGVVGVGQPTDNWRKR